MADAAAPLPDREALPRAVAAALAAAPLAAPATAADALAGFRQAAQTGVEPINSTLSFGPPVDLAAGWDGTIWAIDAQGAPHLYDATSDTWQLHGAGIDAAAPHEPDPGAVFQGRRGADR